MQFEVEFYIHRADLEAADQFSAAPIMHHCGVYFVYSFKNIRVYTDMFLEKQINRKSYELVQV